MKANREIGAANPFDAGSRLVGYLVPAVLTAAIVLLVLLQGGYHTFEPAVAGVALAVACLVAAAGRAPSGGVAGGKVLLAQVVALAAVSLLYIVSALCGGPTVTGLSKSMPWAVALGAFALAVALSRERGSQARLMTWLSVAGICLAYVGLLIYSQALPIAGTMNAERLQFTFQYANAAGAFFLVMAVLCAHSPHPVVRSGWVIPLVALMETQSVAAIALAVLCVAVSWEADYRARAAGLATLSCLGLVSALCVFLCCKVLPAGAGLAGVLIATLVWAGLYQLEKAVGVPDLPLDVKGAAGGHSRKGGKNASRHPAGKGKKAKPHPDSAKGKSKGQDKGPSRPRLSGLGAALGHPPVALACAALVVVAAVAFLALNADRVAQASQTGVERVIQVLDAAALVAANPVLGVGPGNWPYTYADVQSAQYATTVVHCSYAKVAVDAGLLALLDFAGFCACGLWGRVRLMRQTQDPADRRLMRGVLVATAALLLHLAVDFDLEFAALLILLVVLLAPGDVGPAAADGKAPAPATPARTADASARATASTRTFSRAARVGLVAAGVWCACLAGLALYGSSAASQLEDCAERGDADTAEQLMAANPWAASDPACRTQLLVALTGAQRYDRVVDVCAGYEAPLASQQFELAEAYFALGRTSDAEDVLTALCTKYPYQLSVFERTREMASRYDQAFLSDERYTAAVSRANDLAHAGRGAWLDNQKDVGSYGQN